MFTESFVVVISFTWLVVAIFRTSVSGFQTGNLLLQGHDPLIVVTSMEMCGPSNFSSGPCVSIFDDFELLRDFEGVINSPFVPVQLLPDKVNVVIWKPIDKAGEISLLSCFWDVADFGLKFVDKVHHVALVDMEGDKLVDLL